MVDDNTTTNTEQNRTVLVSEPLLVSSGGHDHTLNYTLFDDGAIELEYQHSTIDSRHVDLLLYPDETDMLCTAIVQNYRGASNDVEGDWRAAVSLRGAGGAYDCVRAEFTALGVYLWWRRIDWLHAHDFHLDRTGAMRIVETVAAHDDVIRDSR